MSSNPNIEMNRNRKLYADLKLSLEKDKLYWVINDAKLRAVVSSKSYDEFRDIVAAANLRPITKFDKLRRPRSWNTITDGN